MRKLWRLLLAGALLAGSYGAVAVAAPPASADDDIVTQLKAIPGITIKEEKPTGAPYRFFVLSYVQPVDHRSPEGATFSQQFTLLHKSADRPMVLHTSGYNVYLRPFRSEPTQLIDGNQISVEQRYFTPSRPEPADWSKLDVWQAATDHHRLVTALKRIYATKWISTGASKGGMTSVYHRRFYPKDVDGTVAYVAPNDVNNAEDSAYDQFFTKVGTGKCRKALADIQVEALRRRAELVPKYAAWATENKQTFEEFVGDADHAFEYLVSEAAWAFWQYSPASACANVPKTTAPNDDIMKWLDGVYGFDGYTDEGLVGLVPYYYQAGTQLGAPDIALPHLAGLLKYPGQNTVRTYVPKEIPMTFQPAVMADIDTWVSSTGRKFLFVNGQNDPWSAEPFRVGTGADSYAFTAIGANHGADIGALNPAQQSLSTKALRRWAGVPAPTGLAAQRIPSLDDTNPDLVRRRR
jgi:hypothetical protein